MIYKRLLVVHRFKIFLFVFFIFTILQFFKSFPSVTQQKILYNTQPPFIEKPTPTIDLKKFLIQSCDPVNKDFKQYTVEIAGKTYPQYLLRSQNYSQNFQCLNKTGGTPLILAWNKFYGESNFGYGLGKVKPFIDHHCPVTNCELTMDKSRLKEADYVIVHMSDSFEPLPADRNPKTRWVWMLIESPHYTRNFDNLNGLFNYTSDFLYESEFGSNYESQKGFLWAKNESFDEQHNYHAGKTGFMTALISHCSASSRRLEFIKELQNHIEVQVYGKCGKQCPNNLDCREYVGAKYKFYFAFENSLCRDYITEKFFLMLKYDTIPVVFGMGNYSRFIPETGYIDAQKFESPKHLADYLLYLDKNVTAYNEYFQWKKHVTFLDHIVDYGMICDMCVELHLEKFYGIKKNIIKNFQKYWNRLEQCRGADSIPLLKNL